MLKGMQGAEQSTLFKPHRATDLRIAELSGCFG